MTLILRAAGQWVRLIVRYSDVSGRVALQRSHQPTPPHPRTPITLHQLQGIYRVWVKRGKKGRRGRVGGGRKAGEMRRVSVGWKGYKNIARYWKQSLPLKDNNGARRSQWVKREKTRKEKGEGENSRWNWGRPCTVVGWEAMSRLRLLLPLPCRVSSLNTT